jgi:hypothetical protein
MLLLETQREKMSTLTERERFKRSTNILTSLPDEGQMRASTMPLFQSVISTRMVWFWSDGIVLNVYFYTVLEYTAIYV